MSSKREPFPTKLSVVKQGWGSRSNFQYSYGLRMSPEDLEEGEAILEGLLRNAIAEWLEENPPSEDNPYRQQDLDRVVTINTLRPAPT